MDKESSGNSEEFNFEVDAQLMGELGERLVSKNYIALAELIKNAYDADATEVHVKFINVTSDDEKEAQIEVYDNGQGMSSEVVKNHWMRVATADKRFNPVSKKFGRPKTGNKGIGRFACQSLAKKLTLQSIGYNEKEKNYEKTRIDFDWDKFEPGMDIRDVKFEVKKRIGKETKSNTRLILLELKDIWTKTEYQALKRSLLLLTIVEGVKREGYEYDPGIKIYFEAEEFEETEKEYDIFKEIEDASWGVIECEVNDNGQAIFVIDAKNIEKQQNIIPGNYEELANCVKIRIIFFKEHHYRKKSKITVATIKDIKDNYAGVRVYVQGFRVFPYGDVGNDWLDLDRDQARSLANPEKPFDDHLSKLNLIGSRPLLYLPRNNNLLGKVEIFGELAKRLEINISRQGFIEDSIEFKLLKNLVRRTIDLATLYFAYYKHKTKQEEESKKRKIVEAKTQQIMGSEKLTSKSVYNAMGHISDTISDSKDFSNKDKEDLTVLTRYVKQSIDSREGQMSLLWNIASINSVMLAFYHEIRALQSKLNQDITELNILMNRLENKEDKSLVNNISSQLKKTKDRFGNHLKMYDLMVSKESLVYSKPYFLKVTKNVIDSFKYFIDTSNIEIEISCPENLKTPSIIEPELYSVVINLISNAIKAVINENFKKIKIETKEIDTYFTFSVKDTGVGLDEEYWEKVFEPLVADPQKRIYSTGKKYSPALGQGTGIGLSIVKEIVEKYDGTIQFRTPSKNYKTEVEVKLPWKK